jgi:hypothetical protein
MTAAAVVVLLVASAAGAQIPRRNETLELGARAAAELGRCYTASGG